MNDWGPLEIILGLVLIVGILNSIGHKSTSPFVAPQSSKEVSTLSEKDKRCGLSISAPLSLERVSTTVRLEGAVSGCRWTPSGETALYAQVITGAGVPVSEFTAIPITTSDPVRATFSTTIAIPRNPAKGTGYLILIPAVSEKEALSVRIPVRFVRE